MPNIPPGECRRATWASQATVDPRTRALWVHGANSTVWTRCGTRWDVVAIHPLERGLEAMDRMQVELGAGYPVLADHLSSRLYVMVPAGTGSAAASVPGVRVLSSKHQLLLPQSSYGSEAAHWISAPHATGDPRLVPTDALVTALRAQDAAHTGQAGTS